MATIKELDKKFRDTALEIRVSSGKLKGFKKGKKKGDKLGAFSL